MTEWFPLLLLDVICSERVDNITSVLGKYSVDMSAVLHIIMVALCNRADHYIFMLWFVLLLSSSFSSPNLSGRRLDVYHTLAHGVALVRI